MTNLVPIDHSVMRVHQAVLILLLILAFIFNLPVIVALCCLVMLVGTLLLRRPGFGVIYTLLLKPARIVRPDVLLDNREPHLFAQGVGGFFLLGSTIALFGGFSALGWILGWIVTGLAALNLFAGFCVGCAMYYWLNRFGIPGFNRKAPLGTFPGMRPKSQPHTPSEAS
jgi:hypothetical protein